MAYAYISGVKPSGLSILNACTVNDDGTVDYVETEQTCAEPGIVKCTIVLVDENGSTLYAPRFTLAVAYNSLATVVSVSEFNALSLQVAAANEFRKRSEAWAVGEEDGVPVSSDDETYENNSKFWSDQAAAGIETIMDIAYEILGLEVSATTLQPGQNPTANSSWTPGENLAINFGIPLPNSIVSITLTSTVGKTKTYTITYTNGNTTTFSVTDGTDGQDGRDGRDGQDGRDGIGDPTIIAPDYSTSVSYVAGDLCTKDDKLYVCTASTSGAWDSTKWSQTDVETLLGSVLPAPGTSGNILTSNGSKWVSAAPAPALPSVSLANDGQVLMVVNGAWAAATLPPAEGEVF